MVQSWPRGMLEATETNGVDDREEECDTLMPRAGLNPRQSHGMQAVDTKERHELLAKRRVGCCYFQKSRRKVMKNGLPSFIVGLNFSLSWLLYILHSKSVLNFI